MSDIDFLQPLSIRLLQVGCTRWVALTLELSTNTEALTSFHYEMQPPSLAK